MSSMHARPSSGGFQYGRCVYRVTLSLSCWSIHAAAPVDFTSATAASVGPSDACSSNRTASASRSSPESGEHIAMPSDTHPALSDWRAAAVRSTVNRWFMSATRSLKKLR